MSQVNGFSQGSAPVGELTDIGVDASTPPGTDPVVPDGSNVINMTGGQVAAGTTANSIQTNSVAANQVVIEIQRSSAQATPSVAFNGVSHFNSDDFSVDSDGFVSLASVVQPVEGLVPDSGTSPVVPDGGGDISILGGTGCSTVGSTNTLTINLDATVPLSFPTDSGTATSALNALSILGGTGCSTSGAGSTVTLNLDGGVATIYHTDSGDATPSANAITVDGGNLINTAGSAATLTINADDNVVGSVDTDSGTCTPASNAFTITGAGGITTSASTDTVTIDGSGISNFDWVVEDGTTHNIAVNTGVFCNNAAGVTVTLPAVAAVGDSFQVVAMDAAGFTVALQTGQSIQIGNDVTTTTTGTIVSSSIGDWIEIVCNVANTTFMANIKQGGEITVT